MSQIGVATFSASALKLDVQGRPQCRSCGKTALHTRVSPVRGELGKLGVWCSKCGRCFATVTLQWHVLMQDADLQSAVRAGKMPP
jgi:ribosomal protein L37AE/L43A